MSRDLRKFSRQTNIRLFIGFLLIALVVGDGLVYFFFNKNAALLGLACMAGSLLPIGAIWLVLSLFGYILKRSGRD